VRDESQVARVFMPKIIACHFHKPAHNARKCLLLRVL
jgi:hypothetical protein